MKVQLFGSSILKDKTAKLDLKCTSETITCVDS